jgi:hypothetical protein
MTLTYGLRSSTDRMILEFGPRHSDYDAKLDSKMTPRHDKARLSSSDSTSNFSDLSSGDVTCATDVLSVSDSSIIDGGDSDYEENDLHNQEPAETVSYGVTFGSVHVREFERIIGDHPDTKVGVPLSIGWAYYDRETAVSIEKYEADRIRKVNLRMSSITRKNLLHHVFGIPEDELRAAEKEVQKIKRGKVQLSKQTHAMSPAKAIIRKLRKGGVSFLKGMSVASQSGMVVSGASGMSSFGHMY